MTITNISLAHLRVLSTVAEQGTFSAAAEEIATAGPQIASRGRLAETELVTS